MKNTPTDRSYTKEHEWVRRTSSSEVQIGITDFAQSELGDLVFVDLPKIAAKISKGKTLCIVESTKAASDVYAPVEGTIVTVNEALANAPELINQDPYEAGWICTLAVSVTELTEDLLTAEQYDSYLKGK